MHTAQGLGTIAAMRPRLSWVQSAQTVVGPARAPVLRKQMTQSPSKKQHTHVRTMNSDTNCYSDAWSVLALVRRAAFASGTVFDHNTLAAGRAISSVFRCGALVSGHNVAITARVLTNITAFCRPLVERATVHYHARVCHFSGNCHYLHAGYYSLQNQFERFRGFWN